MQALYYQRQYKDKAYADRIFDEYLKNSKEALARYANVNDPMMRLTVLKSDDPLMKDLFMVYSSIKLSNRSKDGTSTKNDSFAAESWKKAALALFFPASNQVMKSASEYILEPLNQKFISHVHDWTVLTDTTINGWPNDEIKRKIDLAFRSGYLSKVGSLFQWPIDPEASESLDQLNLAITDLELKNISIKDSIALEADRQFNKLLRILAIVVAPGAINKKSAFEAVDQLRDNKIVAQRVSSWLKRRIDKDLMLAKGEGALLGKESFITSVKGKENEFKLIFLFSTFIDHVKKLEAAREMNGVDPYAYFNLDPKASLAQARARLEQKMWRYKAKLEKSLGRSNPDMIKAFAAYEMIRPEGDVDEAMRSDREAKGIISSVGGIDLNPARFNLPVSSQGIGFYIDRAQLAQLQNIDGFVSADLNITLLGDLSEFLGITSLAIDKSSQ